MGIQLCLVYWRHVAKYSMDSISIFIAVSVLSIGSNFQLYSLVDAFLEIEI